MATLAVAVGLRALAGLDPLYAVRAAVLLPALALFVGPRAVSLHPWPTLGPANRVTLFRAVLVGLLVGFCGSPDAERLGWVVFFLAGATFWLDWLDGRVARGTGSASPFGARLDMELDALTVVGLTVLCWQLGRAGPWVLAAAAARYAFAAAGAVWPWLRAPLPPSARRPWACGVLVACLIAALWPPLSPGLAAAVAAVGVVAVLGSFAIDVVWLARAR